MEHVNSPPSWRGNTAAWTTMSGTNKEVVIVKLEGASKGEAAGMML